MNPEHFTLHEVVPGVWEAEADFSKPSVGNAAIIDAGGGKTIVVDTFMTVVAAEELRAVAERLTGNSVYLAVNSHWHGDHTTGNQVFADVPIVSTRATLDKLVETAPADVEAWQAEIQQQIDALTAAAEGGDESARGRLVVMTAFRDTAGRFELTLPDLLVEDRLVVEGERTVEIITYGRGHTVSDTVVWLPDDRLVVTGDLCWTGIHPRTQDGFPADWAAYVEQLIGLGPRHVVPGHGEPVDETSLEPLPAYFRAVGDAVEAVRDGADAGELEAPPGSEDWQGLERFQTGVEILAAG
jgi:glyoxylase-like metal-dependent hydrolase (beta-lactamase superfamily II)